MLWVSPAAWLGAVAVAAPVLIHLLVQRRAETLPFPTLRFLEPTRFASIRRHRLDDRVLLLVRATIVVAAACAFAGPVAITAARLATWNARTVRAVVTDLTSPEAGQAAGSAFRAWQIETPDLKAGIRAAIRWLNEAPPGRRELVVVSAFPLTAISSEDIAVVPQNIGIRFVRAGTLPRRRTVDGGSRIALPEARQSTTSLLASTASRRRLSVVLDGSWTRVVAGGDDDMALPIEIDVPEGDRMYATAALTAVLSHGVFAPASGRAARLAIGDEAAAAKLDAGSVRRPWMADAIASIGRDPELQRAGGALASGLGDDSFARPPWIAVAAADDGTPAVAAAADGDRLLLASAAPAFDLATPVLLRAVLTALAPAEPVYQEVLSIRDEQLRAWQREPAAVARPAQEVIDRDDRRWVWAAVLALLAVETWARRSRTRQDDEALARESEATRVA